MKEFWRRLQWFARRDRFASELDEEMRHHLALKAEEQGGTDAAQRKFGNVTLLQEDSRAIGTWTFCEQFAQDIRHDLRFASG